MDKKGKRVCRKLQNLLFFQETDLMYVDYINVVYVCPELYMGALKLVRTGYVNLLGICENLSLSF